jgi:hypothetical protein
MHHIFTSRGKSVVKGPSGPYRTPRRGRAVQYLVCLLVGLALAPRDAIAESSFLLIVNDANPVAQLRAKEVAALFLKETTKWPDGTRAAPVNLSEGSPLREGFSRRVHREGTAGIKAYWQKMIFSGRDVPPPEKASPVEVVTYVRSKRGAIGYVPVGTSLGPGVKKIDLLP